ncbi:hypothetical protein [Helicobacter sp. MIT 14-3879]|uniref:hypothetical protein n=1 Tax=Helicobacter sp. MIT 14-3879 TaxID=2040649 RepID=UPI000E1EAE11|nr:hypothetical protein [Helicobacter sp. MIT 14-3879]RDU64103.1 hypothetical protein CQA44_04035 [Helicobacter sp. MIT 14-3879]
MKTLQNALIEAIRESMGIMLKKDNKLLKKAFSSKITLDNKNFIIVINKPLLEKFALDFLDIVNPNDDILIDIAKEIANLIIGKAKVLYENSGSIFKLGIPEFIGYKVIKNYNNVLSYKYKNMRCSIYEVV